MQGVNLAPCKYPNKKSTLNLARKIYQLVADFSSSFYKCHQNLSAMLAHLTFGRQS